MANNSGFIVDPIDKTVNNQCELICSSSEWFELYRIDRLGQFRVLKALKQEYRGVAKYEALLRKEFEIGYCLKHPNICETISFVHSNDLGNAIELEWIDGSSLSELINSGNLAPKAARRVISQLCDALSYIHSKQVIHRDVKPSNIMITHNGGNVKLIDFGFSDTDAHSVFKSAAGTASFAAPELLENGPVDCRADIFSAGKIIAIICPKARRIAEKCMRPNPEDRYSDAASLKENFLRKKGGGRRFAAAAILALLSFAAFALLQRQNTVMENEKAGKVTDSLSVVNDPAVIDDIFLRATDMIESEGSLK